MKAIRIALVALCLLCIPAVIQAQNPVEGDTTIVFPGSQVVLLFDGAFEHRDGGGTHLAVRFRDRHRQDIPVS
jgi:hypothetical protein